MILNEASGMSKVKKTKKAKKKKTPSYSGSHPLLGGHRNSDGAKKKKSKPKKKVTPSYSGSHPLLGGNRNSDGVTKKKKKSTSKHKKTPSYSGSHPLLGGNRNSDKTGYKAPVKKKKKKITAKNKSMINTHEDQTNNKAVRDAWNKAHGIGTKKAPTTKVVAKKPVTSTTKKPVVSTKAPVTKAPVKTTTPKTNPVTKVPVGKGNPVTKKPKSTTPKKPATKPAAPKATDWSKYTKDQLLKDDKLRADYIKANPTSAYTKEWQTNDYKRYNDMILNDKGMTDGQRKYYNELLGKWGFEDYNDVNVQNQYHLKQDKQKAIDAETVQLNQSLGTMDAQAFQQKQQMQQEMATRGITDSGIAADAYARAQALNGQNYSQAYADSAKTKADITAQYTDALNQSKQTQAEAKAAQEAATAESITEQLKAQTEQDKYLTSSTGYVYLNGKVLKDKAGNPLTSMAYMKLQEENRHNIAGESAAMQKINNDLAMATQKLNYNWASLDLKSQQAQADIANAQAKLELAARNADTAEVRVQAGILNNEIKSIQKQIDGYKKAGKKVPKSLKSKLKKVMGKMDKLANMGK
jgi:hypothetical protein